MLPHTPPGVASDSVIDDNKQTVVEPDIGATVGNGLIVIGYEAIDVPHALNMEYLMVSTPAEIPVTTPVAETVAREGVEDNHVPPETVSVNVVAEPMQTADAPEIVPGFGKALTVTLRSAIAVPHELGIE
jgi:hypothetical protein